MIRLQVFLIAFVAVGAIFLIARHQQVRSLLDSKAIEFTGCRLVQGGDSSTMIFECDHGYSIAIEMKDRK